VSGPAETILANAQQALWQYISDLRFPPTGDSVERRLEAAERASSALDALIAERIAA
jgi:hypothetical protein